MGLYHPSELGAMKRRSTATLAFLGTLSLPFLITAVEIKRGKGDAAVLGLDHVIVAINDLEATAQRYRDLGFALKPGRPHDNGIRNQHVKFPDGTEIELLTAPEARDDLTAQYRRHLAGGDGPAFFALFEPESGLVARRLDAAGMSYERDGGMVDFPPSHPLGYIFFAHRNQSPTDRPEHFAHPNTAYSLIAVWLAGDDLSPERKLLAAFGGAVRKQTVLAPEPVRVEVVSLQDAQIYLLPASRRLMPGRKIVGATVAVRSLAAARAAVHAELPRGALSGRGKSIFLPPSVTHGIWLELREAH
jgi:catechol 2,3-dioxygenase-like lactoylglutathione lyase family enzyme